MEPTTSVSAMPLSVDGTDPVIAFLAWGIVALIRKYAPHSWDRFLRKGTPFLAVLVAVFIRALISVVLSEPFTLALFIRAFGAGAAAVLGHSQFRELLKVEMAPNPARKKPAPKVDDQEKKNTTLPA